MTTKSLMRLCAASEGTIGACLIGWPDFVPREVLRGVSSLDVAVARGLGFVLLVLGLACWPFENDINPQTISAQLIYKPVHSALSVISESQKSCQQSPMADLCSTYSDYGAAGGDGIRKTFISNVRMCKSALATIVDPADQSHL
jgi:hypothetical protein